MSSGDFVSADMGSFRDFLDDASKRIEVSLPLLREQMASRALDQTVAYDIINAVHEFNESISQMIPVTDEYADYLEANEAYEQPVAEDAPSLVEPAPADEVEKTPHHDDIFDNDYNITVLQEFFMTRSPFTAADFRRYLELTEDFTDQQVSKITRNIKRALNIVKESLEEDGVMTHILDDRDLKTITFIEGVKPQKHYALALIDNTTQVPRNAMASKAPTPTAATVGQADSILKESKTGLFVSPAISIIELTSDAFDASSLSDDQREVVRNFIVALFERPSEVVISSAMKQRVAAVLNNRNVGLNEANILLNKAYQARLIGKKDIEERVYYVRDSEQRRNPRERQRQNVANRKKETAIDFVGKGVEDMFVVLVEDLTHVTQKMTPDKMSQLIKARTGRSMGADMIKMIARNLDHYFVVAEGSLGGKSPHAKSRSQKVLTIRLKDQIVKDAWKNDRNTILSSIDALYEAQKQLAN